MGRRTDWGSLEARVTRSSPPPAATAPTPPSVEPVALPVKPCWVTDRHGRLPGLLLQWKPTSEGYLGRVVRPVLDQEGWAVVEEWLPAAMLEAGAPDPSPR